MPAPIVIMSFNRAQFFAPVIASLKAQEPDGVAGREVHLFQDGAVNRYSKLRYAEDAEIAACIDLFRREFPEGIVHASPDNIGICENFKRAEEYLFVEREFDCAWFFEDDLVLSPAYFQMMERLQSFAENIGTVAYFAAYGNYYARPEEITERRRELMNLDHHWGFGLFKRHWQEMQPLLADFYSIVVGEDYSRRDHRKIFALYAPMDRAVRASSQDAAKAFAADQLGLWRCNTVVPFAKYIGTSGQHMTPEMFSGLGFDNAAVSLFPVSDLQLPGPSEIREKVLEQRTLLHEIRAREFDEITANLPPTMFNPVRLITRQEIASAYELLLRRPTESDEIFERHAGLRTVQVFVNSILASDEFRSFVDERAPEFTFKDAVSRGISSREDLYKIYGLLCHREPEQSVIERHSGRTFIDLVVQGVFRSDEFRRLQSRSCLN